MESCLDLCSNFSYTTFDSFFDGNFELLKRVNVMLFSFFRKVRDDSLLAFDKKEFQRLMDKIDKIDLSKMGFNGDRDLHGMLADYTD